MSYLAEEDTQLIARRSKSQAAWWGLRTVMVVVVTGLVVVVMGLVVAVGVAVAVTGSGVGVVTGLVVVVVSSVAGKRLWRQVR